MSARPFFNARAGFGVRRGRLPGATEHGCVGSAQDCEPRPDARMPTPGMIGELFEPSLGVHENALPCRSTTQTYDVSPGRTSPGSGAGIFARGRPCEPGGLPAGGISVHAL